MDKQKLYDVYAGVIYSAAFHARMTELAIKSKDEDKIREAMMTESETTGHAEGVVHLIDALHLADWDEDETFRRIEDKQIEKARRDADTVAAAKNLYA